MKAGAIESIGLESLDLIEEDGEEEEEEEELEEEDPGLGFLRGRYL